MEIEDIRSVCMGLLELANQRLPPVVYSLVFGEAMGER
jgi:hypothetical protein